MSDDDQERGIVELGITRNNYKELTLGKSVIVEHGMTSSNGHFREPYLKGML